MVMIVKSWGILVGAGAGLLVFACLVTWCALRLIRSNRDQVLGSSALVPAAEFDLAEAGEVVVLLETPRMESGYAKVKFAVTDQGTGATTEMPYQYARARGAVRGMSTVRIPFGRLTVARPGKLVVRVSGLDAVHDYSGSRIVLSRPYLGRMALQIVGIVVCAVAALLCLILGAWQIFPPQPAR
jgi:hypothetical protein